MRANARNEFYFVPDDKLDIWPDGIGFEPVSVRLSEKVEEKMPDQIRQDEKLVRQDKEPVRNNGNDTAAQPKPAARPSWDQEEIPDDRDHGRTWRIVLLVLGILVVLFIAAAYLFTDEMSPILDRLLYTKEELELLRR
jgi:hypothetical protein